MPEIELDDDKEEASNSKHAASNSAANCILKSNTVSSVVPRVKMQKQVATGQFSYNPPITEKAKELLSSGVKIITGSAKANDIGDTPKSEFRPESKITGSEKPEESLHNQVCSQSLNLGSNLRLMLTSAGSNFISYSLNLAGECQNMCKDLYLDLNTAYTETQQYLSNLYKNCFSSLAKLYGRLKESILDAIRYVNKFFERKESLSSRSDSNQDPQISDTKHEHIIVAAAGQTQNGSSGSIKDDQSDQTLSNKLRNLLENLSETFAKKELEKKLSDEQNIIQHQIKLGQEADRAFSEALLKRPDLASKLTRPQVAFLSTSPFAKLPSADDLIEQAEKAPTIH